MYHFPCALHLISIRERERMKICLPSFSHKYTHNMTRILSRFTDPITRKIYIMQLDRKFKLFNMT